MDEVAEVKGRLEITEVVASYVPLKQAGRNLKAPCPFHQEKSASFMVSPEKGIYHCFGCGEGGDIFNFVMKMEGVDFREALEMLARKAGVELKARGGDDGVAKKFRTRLLAAHELAVKYFQLSLIKNQKALDYIVKKRKLGRQTIKDFQIGYAPDSWNGLTDFLQSQGFSKQELLQAGLAGQKQGNSSIYDLFRGRAMFTIADREGHPIGFTGRVLDDSLPKYLNTPQTQLYDKSQAIFGLHLAKEAIRIEKAVVLVEGNMDVVASHQAGIKNVVATSGTALTSTQLKLISGLTKKVILAFDSDRAGMAATQKAVPLAQVHGIQLFALQLEGAKDADELIQKDTNLWVEAIKSAQEIRDYWLDRGKKEFDLSSSFGKKLFIDRMIEVAELYASTDLDDRSSGKTTLDQDLFLARVVEASGIDMSTLRNALSKVDKNKKEKLQSSTNEVSKTRLDSSQGYETPTRRAVDQNVGRRSVRVQHEELFLAINLICPSARASLHDLSVERFSSPDRKVTYELMVAHPHTPGPELAGMSPEVSSYVKRLLLIAEEEYAEAEEPALQQTAFEIARMVFLESNQQIKDQLSLDLRHAEQNGDKEALARLLSEYKKIIDSEA